MLSLRYIFSILLLITVIATPGAYAFGAGEIPDFTYLNGKAFRHGDLENILKDMYKVVGGHHGGFGFGGGVGSILAGVAGAIASRGGTKFTTMDVKRVYLGNFLCDYSQSMDIAGLTKLSADSIVTIVMALGFMAFGYATDEFEITADRLGVYLPVTHIDNPKGYGEGQDPRDVHPKLRPPVDPEELEIDESNGMKNYIATEGRGWDTSTALLKRIFRECIERGRRAQGQDGDDLFEAFRLLGTGLHTLEDLLAHSNWCELTLRKMGHQNIFCHVGDNVLVNSPRGRVPPLVTGTFGSADFLHSLLGEATDHLSEASLTDLTKRMGSASTNSGPGEGNSPISKVISLFSKIPSLGGDKKEKLNQGEDMKAKALDLKGKIDEAEPGVVRGQLWQVLEWRDGLMKDISGTIASIPGLEHLLDQSTESLNVYVFSILEPFMTPVLQKATAGLQEGSSAVIEANEQDQYQVFDNPDASDPSHSLLSKDHFALILNEPAGKVAMVVVRHTVELLVSAWYDENADIDQVICTILEAFHHPYYVTGRSKIQNDMADELHRWIEGMSHGDRESVFNSLTKEAVRAGRNKRAGHENDNVAGCGHGGIPVSGGGDRSAYGNRPPQQQPHRQQEHRPNEYGSSDTYNQYGSGERRQPDRDSYGGYGEQRQEYGDQTQHRSQDPYGSGGYSATERRQQVDVSSSWNDTETSGYANQSSGYGDQSSGYGGGYHQDQLATGYGRLKEESYSSQSEVYSRSGVIRQEEEEVPRRPGRGYGEGNQGPGYGRHQGVSYEGAGYGVEQEPPRYGGERERPLYVGEQERPSYGGEVGPRYGGGGGEGYTQSLRHEGGGYGEEERPHHHRRDDEGGESYSRHERRDEGYGGADFSYSGDSGGYGRRHDENSGYGAGGRQEEESYATQSRYQAGSDDTFGAEGLNLDDNDGYGRRHHNEYPSESQYGSRY